MEHKGMPYVKFALTIALLCHTYAYGTDYYVDGTCGDDANTGTTSDCNDPNGNGPTLTIQAGIDSTTTNGDVVRVAPGTYTGTGNRDIVYTPWGVNDPRHVTVLCDGAAGTCVVDAQAASGNRHRGFNFDHQLVEPNLTRGAVLDGFRIKGGYESDGGGIRISQTSPTIRNCFVEDNTSTRDGGGIYLDKDSGPLIENCTIGPNNHANQNGGGITILFAVGTVVPPEIVGCVITENSAGSLGGGLSVAGNADGTIVKETRIEMNTSGREGGGVSIVGSLASVVFANCVIAQNAAGSGFSGGGVNIFGGNTHQIPAVPEFSNTVIVDNQAWNGAGVYVIGYTELLMSNVTIVGNTASDSAGGHAIRFQAFTFPINNPHRSVVSNSILWTVTDPPPPGALVTWGDGDLTIQESDIEDTLPVEVTAINNIIPPADPQFVDADGPDDVLGTVDDNFRLSSSSPCVDTGDETLRLADLADLDGDGDLAELTPLDHDLFARVVGFEVDMGVYEFDDCTSDAECDDQDLCNGVETCVGGNCIRDLTDCNGNGVEDVCDIGPTSDDCNTNGIPDECEVDVDVSLIATCYACDDSLPKTRQHVLRLQFACPVALPQAGAPVEIKELGAGGTFLGADLADEFDYTLEQGGLVLRIEEDGCPNGTCDFDASNPQCSNDSSACATVLDHETWYGIINTGGWVDVEVFELDYADLRGNADNGGFTDFGDLSFINARQTASASDDDRADINSDGIVDFDDLVAANVYVYSTKPTKPSGHTCTTTGQMSSCGG